MATLHIPQLKVLGRQPRWAVFGGSFNPVHLGHEFIMEQVSQLIDVDQLLVVPTGCSPWKHKDDYLPAALRLKMLRVVVGRLPGVQLWEEEIKQSDTSYSLDTFRKLKKLAPGVRWHWVLGEDALRGFPNWSGAQELACSVNLIVIPRPSTSKSQSVRRLHQSLSALQEWYLSLGVPEERRRVLVIKAHPPRVSGHDILHAQKLGGLATDVRRIMLQHQREKAQKD